jgi:Predicted nucleic-acid-binding protein, contains PIN domain
VIAVDTNILVRLVTRDDPGQAERAAALFGRERIFIPKTVMLETEWVLRYSYELSPAVVLDALKRIAGLPRVEVEDDRSVAAALAWAEEGMDFADALHLASGRHADAFASFDARLVNKARALQAGRVETP